MKLQQPLLRASGETRPPLFKGKGATTGSRPRARAARTVGPQPINSLGPQRDAPGVANILPTIEPIVQPRMPSAGSATEEGSSKLCARQPKWVVSSLMSEAPATPCSGDSDDAFLGALEDKCPPESDDPWAVQLTLQGKPVMLNIDTGAEVTVISDQIWKAVGQPILNPPTTLPQRSRLKRPSAHEGSSLAHSNWVHELLLRRFTLPQS